MSEGVPIKRGTESPPGPPPGFTLRPLILGDLEEVAKIHLSAFRDSALARLGHEATRRSYQWQLAGPHAVVALAADRGDRLSGYLIGGHFRGAQVGFVRKELWFLAGRLCLHPTLLLQAVGRARLRLALRLLLRRKRPQPRATPSKPSFGILAVAVRPSEQGKGIGRALMAAARDRARSDGYRSMHLNVHRRNAGAIALYKSLGFVETADSSTANGQSAHLTLDLCE